MKVFIPVSFIRKKFYYTESMKKFIIFKRASLINEVFMGNLVYVYNGFKFIRFSIEEQFLGKKFGEFSFTKKIGISYHLRSSRNAKVKGKLKVVKKK